MEAHLQIVGCVLASKPAPELIDAFVAQVRRERVSVLVKSAQGATFVRFGASDAKLVTLAGEAVRMAATAASAPTAARLRFGFAVGTKVSPGPGEDGLDISTRSIVQANDLAAGAEDGEVLVSPQLAVWLIEWGFALRSKQVPLPGSRLVAACTLEWPAQASRAAPAPDTSAFLDSRPLEMPAEPRPKARAAGGLAPLSPAPAAPDAAPASSEGAAASRAKVEALGQVFRALLVQAEEVARRQVEVEARQDAVLGKMTLAGEGSLSARHLGELESELEAQVARVESKLDFVERLEQRVGQAQAVLSDLERRLNQQLQRRSEVESLKALCDSLLAQMIEAQPRLEGMAAVQERLLPMATQVAALAQSLETSQRALGQFESRLGEVRQGVDGLDRQIDSLAEREAGVQAVKAELESLREMGARSRADLEFVAAQQGELVEFRAKVEALRASALEADDKMVQIEARRRLVDEVQASVHAITHTMGDLQLKLELLNEQRMVIEHVGDKVARLDFTVQEAQNTLRALQREREVAERIEQGIKALRARSGVGQVS